MILQRLHELSVRKGLTLDPAFVNKEISCRIDIGDGGEFLGIQDLRQNKTLPAKSSKGKPKTVLDNGLSFLIPVRPVVWDDKAARWKATDPASSGAEKPAVFLADAIGRVLPVNQLIEPAQQAKFESQRSTFWRFLTYVISETDATYFEPLILFRDRLLDNEQLSQEISDQVVAQKLTTASLCTLGIRSQMGRAIVEDETLLAFWREFFTSDLNQQQSNSYQGLCQVTKSIGPIGESIKSRVKGLMAIGCRADAYLVTGIGSAESYNLNASSNAMISEAGVDSFTRAANALIGNDFPGQRTSYRIGSVMFLFWTRNDSDPGVFNILEPQPEFVESLLKSPVSGKLHEAIETSDDFYLLTLSGNSARVVVRDYLETPLARLQVHLRNWFRDLRIADVSQEGGGQPSSRFPLQILCVITAMDFDTIAPDVPDQLMKAAVQGGPVPETVLIACLRRLRAEGANGFRAARMALIKLILIRQGITMTETLDTDENHHAYVFGRSLCVFAQIQHAALGDVNANVVDKFYGVFSTSPSLIWNRLISNSMNHLRKIKSESPGRAFNLEKRLSAIVEKLPPSPPTGILSVRDQGRFAIGYYHERAKFFEDIATRKAEKQQATIDKIN